MKYNSTLVLDGMTYQFNDPKAEVNNSRLRENAGWGKSNSMNLLNNHFQVKHWTFFGMMRVKTKNL